MRGRDGPWSRSSKRWGASTGPEPPGSSTPARFFLVSGGYRVVAVYDNNRGRNRVPHTHLVTAEAD
jgi:hypothetical protein